MTETATYGATSQPQPAFINGSTPLDHGLRRRSVRSDSRLSSSDRRAADATARAGAEDSDATLPLLELPHITDTLRLWQSSCAASYRLTEIVWGAIGAATSAHLARAQESGERAVAVGRAIAAADDQLARTELLWGYLQESVDRRFAGVAASLDLVATSSREILELLAPPAADDTVAEPEATDRAA